MTSNKIELELAPKLQRENIVTKYLFDLNNLDIILELNHKYDKKTIVSPLEIGDWQYTIQKFKENLENQGIHEDHIAMICDDACINASKRLDDYVDNSGNKKKSKDRRDFTVYKYSNNFRGDLHEAVIIGGKPCFIKCSNKTIKITKSIKEESSGICM
jgi:hypothetical protein